jgi:hypothetical protein
MNKLYSWVAQLLLSKILGGKKTIILGWIVSILGAWNIIASTENVQALCETQNICLAANATWGWISVTIGEIMKVLRFATGQEYEDPKFKK